MNTLNSCNDVVYIYGDFYLDLLHFRNNYKISTFLNIFAPGEFIQFVMNKPTRWNITGCKTLIDNIFVKNSSCNLHSGIVLTDISDHFLIYMNIHIKEKKSHTNTIIKRDFSFKNRIKFISDLSQTDWTNLFNTKETQIAYSFLHKLICDTFYNHFQLKTVSNKYKDRLHWLTKDLKSDIKLRNKLFTKSKKYPTQLNIKLYKAFKRKLNKRMSNTKRSYYNNKLDENRSNIKKTLGNY